MLKYDKQKPSWQQNIITLEHTVNPHYIDTWFNDTFLYTDNLTNMEPLSQEVTVNQKLCRNIIQYFK